MPRTLPPFARSARALIVWCVLVATAVYGFTGVLVDMLGARHVHVVPAADLTMAGWKDFRRAVPTQAPHGHTHEAEAGAGVGGTMPHAHAAFERHHHDANDASVIALDGSSADGNPADDGGASAGSAHLVALTFTVSLVALPGARAEWLTAEDPRVMRWVAGPGKRPPRA